MRPFFSRYSHSTPMLCRSRIAFYETPPTPTGGVIDHPHQVTHWPPAFHPVVLRDVPLHQLPKGTPPRPPTMHLLQPARFALPQSGFLSSIPTRSLCPSGSGAAWPTVRRRTSVQNRPNPAASGSPELVSASQPEACDWTAAPAAHAPPPHPLAWPCASSSWRTQRSLTPIFWAASRWLILPSWARFSQSNQSRSSWLIAIRSILLPFGCQEELSTWLN